MQNHQQQHKIGCWWVSGFRSNDQSGSTQEDPIQRLSSPWIPPVQVWISFFFTYQIHICLHLIFLLLLFLFYSFVLLMRFDMVWWDGTWPALHCVIKIYRQGALVHTHTQTCLAKYWTDSYACMCVSGLTCSKCAAFDSLWGSLTPLHFHHLHPLLSVLSSSSLTIVSLLCYWHWQGAELRTISNQPPNLSARSLFFIFSS